MNTETYDDNDIDDDCNLDSGISGFEIAYGSRNTRAIGKALRNKSRIKQKLDSIHEKRTLDRQLDSFNGYWDH